MKAEALKGHLDLLLLAVVGRGPAHGYAIIATLRDDSRGVFDLPEGTVYPALHRLERAGLLDSRWDERSARRRRLYSLSGRGAEALAERRVEWQTFATGVAGIVGATA